MQKIALAIILIALLCSAAIVTLVANLVYAQSTEYVIIKADGSIEPVTAPIIGNGNLYTVTDDISQYLVVERNYTFLNGVGHIINGVLGQLPAESVDWSIIETTNMTVTNVVVNEEGIFFLSTENSVFSNNTINNGQGLDCNGDGNIIANTTVNYGRGLSVNGKNNLVSDNHLNNCNYTFAENNPPPYGIGVGGSNNIVARNYIIGTNGSAINLGTSSDNTIFGNQIGNNKIGIRTMAIYSQISAENNTIYNNNFVNNQENYRDEMIMIAPNSVTKWDYNTIGNYWSNYNGSDTNGDGKGDTPYLIDANNRDNYPLMNLVDITQISNLPKPSPFPTPIPSNNLMPLNSPNPSPYPSPTVPEFSWLIILPLFLSILSIVVLTRKRKESRKVKSIYLAINERCWYLNNYCVA